MQEFTLREFDAEYETTRLRVFPKGGGTLYNTLKPGSRVPVWLLWRGEISLLAAGIEPRFCSTVPFAVPTAASHCQVPSDRPAVVSVTPQGIMIIRY